MPFHFLPDQEESAFITHFTQLCGLFYTNTVLLNTWYKIFFFFSSRIVALALIPLMNTRVEAAQTETADIISKQLEP